MAVEDDIADWVAGEVTQLGLEFQGTEISGNGYAALTPSYTAASGGSTDLSATLEFDGPANEDVDAVRFYWDPGTPEVWFTRSLSAATAFNSDGRLDLTSAPIDVTVS